MSLESWVWPHKRSSRTTIGGCDNGSEDDGGGSQGFLRLPAGRSQQERDDDRRYQGSAVRAGRGCRWTQGLRRGAR